MSEEKAIFVVILMNIKDRFWTTLETIFTSYVQNVLIQGLYKGLF